MKKFFEYRFIDFDMVIRFVALEGNGRVFARREIVRMAKKLHLQAWSMPPYDDRVYVTVRSRRDKERWWELIKYINGKRFNRRCTNNGWWNAHELERELEMWERAVKGGE